MYVLDDPLTEHKYLQKDPIVVKSIEVVKRIKPGKSVENDSNATDIQVNFDVTARGGYIDERNKEQDKEIEQLKDQLLLKDAIITKLQEKFKKTQDGTTMQIIEKNNLILDMAEQIAGKDTAIEKMTRENTILINDKKTLEEELAFLRSQ